MQRSITTDGTHTAPDPQLDYWFTALDRIPVRLGSMPSVTQVTGIHTHEGGLWIQIEPAGRPEMALLLRVSPETTTAEAKMALNAAWSGKTPTRATVDLTAA